MTKKQYLIIAVSLCALTVLVVLAAVLHAGSAGKTEFTPPKADTSASREAFDYSEAEGYEIFSANGFYQVGICGALTLSDGKIDVLFVSPESNGVLLMLKITDKNGNILGQTGTIEPGQHIESLTLSADLKETTEVTMKVMAYDPQTYYSAGTISLGTSIYVEQ